MKYNRCGKSGLLLPQISLGLWHNFGSVDNFENGESIVKDAFDKGITHFDLANNYGPVPGSAETNFGKILKNNFQGNLRDQMVISTKAGYTMWEGPYGDWGSRKYLLSSLDQSLKRMDLEYVDIFYSHRPDPETPIEETMMALDHAVRSGKALYVGISNYSAEQTKVAVEVLKELGTPCLIHQAKYSMFQRWVEDGLLDVLEDKGVGCIAFSPLAQGLLTDKYLKGIPENSRAHNPNGHLKREEVSEERIQKIIQLNEIAKERGQSLAQMALAWLMKDNRVTSVLIGASSVGQLNNNLESLKMVEFSKSEIDTIASILG
ncbi:L-glyceraldehyde 3-phosphate reductase [Flavobacterium sp. NG2]|uniref:L-glyceraldehyde 3-phosphate reductase n=1 Tax=Flavobacterium sp. NG2 TaxID=3097547 RepID=UPI002A80C875|nr:L-glyceraldehyde 3-phosphate reductase [Flavobacterium sp. NG2]WPR71270.1 L-glyceraldehyde 3-phosphate reductase [Flavobacterium sp. NG2]